MNERIEYLTQVQKEELETQLAELEGPKRKAAVEAIATARAHGDLSENFEYHAAKNEQGLLEARIRVLRDRLERSQVIDEQAAAEAQHVTIGSRVEIEDEKGERMAVEISSVGGVSPDSPLGSALMGGEVGQVVTVAAPRGSWKATIVSIGR